MSLRLNPGDHFRVVIELRRPVSRPDAVSEWLTEPGSVLVLPEERAAQVVRLRSWLLASAVIIGAQAAVIAWMFTRLISQP